MIGKILLHIGKNVSGDLASLRFFPICNNMLANKFGSFQKTTGGFGVVAAVQPQVNLSFLCSFKFGKGVFSTETTTKLFHN